MPIKGYLPKTELSGFPKEILNLLYDSVCWSWDFKVEFSPLQSDIPITLLYLIVVVDPIRRLLVVIPGKIYQNSGMIHFAEINQVPSPYSMLQHIGIVATTNLVPRNYLRYLQTTLIMGGGGLVSEFMWGM